jgi:hypothetical protein
MHAYINETPKRHVLASNLVVWAIMHVCVTPRSAVTRLREKNTKKKKKNLSKEKKSQSRYISLKLSRWVRYFENYLTLGSWNLANSYSSTRAIVGIQNGRSISNRFRDIRGQSSTFDLDYLRNGWTDRVQISSVARLRWPLQIAMTCRLYLGNGPR